jgi:hypothetical protein
MHSVLSSLVWLMLAGGAGVAAYLHYNHSLQSAGGAVEAQRNPPPAAVTAAEPSAESQPAAPEPADVGAPVNSDAVAIVNAPPAQTAAVTVSMKASEPAWVQVTADGKNAFTGTMQPNETREIAATEQVKIMTGNAGALTISLNGKTIDSLGPLGQIRSVRLTAEGPESPKAPQPVPPDPL